MLAPLQPEAMRQAHGSVKHGFTEEKREHGSRTPKLCFRVLRCKGKPQRGN
jgi:hypothetical protein